MKIAIIRGAYLNQYEMQNYQSLVSRKHVLTAFSSLKPIHQNYNFPLIKLKSPTDLPDFPYKMPILNRLCFGDAMYLFGLEKQLSGFDIAHVAETYFHFTQQALNAKKAGYVKKVVSSCSETIAFNNQGIWPRKQFKQKAIKEVDVFHCWTNKAKECLLKEGCDPKKIKVLYYGVDLKKFKPIKRFRQSKIVKLLFVGRLVKEKGIYDLVKVFVKLIKNYHKIILTIIGDGREKDPLINLVNRVGLNKFVSFKQVNYKAMPLEYQKSDIFILLSKPTKYWEEYFGMVLVEAMACGLPIVSCLAGAIPEVVNNAGFLVNPGDWQQAYTYTKKLILDSSLRRKIGKRGRRRVELNFNSEKFAQNIEKLYLNCLL